MAKKIKLNGSDEVVTKYAIKDAHGTDLNQASLQSQIDNLSSLQRYLSGWNAQTGLATTNPPQSPYTYRTGDYFVINVVDFVSQYLAYDSTATYNTGDKVTYNSATYLCIEDGVTGNWDSSKWTAHTPKNYKPSGSQYITDTPSTTEETNAISVGDRYVYDGTTWNWEKVAPIDTSAFGKLASNNTWTGTNNFSNVLPNSNNLYDLGSSTNKWKDVYLSGSVKLNSITSGGLTITNNGWDSVIQQAGGAGMTIGGDAIRPTSTTLNLGASWLKWNNIYLSGDLSDGTNQTSVAKINHNFAPDYSSSSTYNVGDYVIYQGALYKCNTQITTAETWTSAHWTAVAITDELGSGGTEVSAIPFSYSNTTLQGIAIGGTNYKLVPFNFDGSTSICLGPAASYRGYNSTAVGRNAQSYSNATALGNSATAQGTESISIGNSSFTKIENSVSFDGTYSTLRTLLVYDLSKVFLKNDQQTSSNTTLASFANGYSLAERLNGLAITDNSITQLDYDKVLYQTISTNTTYTFKTAPTSTGTNLSCKPEYKCVLNVTTASNITLPEGTYLFKTDDSSKATMTDNVISLAAGNTYEIIIQDGRVKCWVW